MATQAGQQTILTMANLIFTITLLPSWDWEYWTFSTCMFSLYKYKVMSLHAEESIKSHAKEEEAA
jgi:hypothetical protein